MAKGSFLGVKRGKLGDAVGYNVTNSNNKDTQGWRVYQPVVSNPQTDGQIDQRVKMAAANNLYRALKSIIQRGWENHKYGDESRRAFLKRAMGADFAGPYIEKGSTLAVPIEGVPITYGSLTPVVVECGAAEVVLANVPFPESATAATIGGFSTLFIDAGLAQPGDQITIILATLNGAGNVSYLTRSFYVNPDSADNVEDVLGYAISADSYDGGSVAAIDVAVITGFSATHFAAMVSISRDGETSNLRSYAEFDMTSEFREYFYGSASQIERAKASYRKKTSSNTNWELVPGDDTEVAPGNTVGVLNSATPEQVIITGYRTQNGYAQVFDANNSVWRYVYATGVQGTSYHKWLTSNKTSESMWDSTAPSGAETAQAIRFSASNDANAADLAFARWLNDEVGYVGYYLFR